MIGVGHGRTLAAVVEQLPQTPAPGVKFVSLLGGLTRKFAANPFDVIHRLAERTGAEAYLLPVPVFANSVADSVGADEAIRHRRCLRARPQGLVAVRRHRPGEPRRLPGVERHDQAR